MFMNEFCSPQKCSTWCKLMIFIGLLKARGCEEVVSKEGEGRKGEWYYGPLCLNQRISALNTFINSTSVEDILKEKSYKIIDDSASYQLSPSFIFRNLVHKYKLLLSWWISHFIRWLCSLSLYQNRFLFINDK